MSWFADLAGKAESLLTNLDEQTGAALKNHNAGKQKKYDNYEPTATDYNWTTKKKSSPRSNRKMTSVIETSNRKLPSPIKPRFRSQTKENNECVQENMSFAKSKKMPSVKTSSLYFHLNNCPKTLVGDIQDSEIVMDQLKSALKERRHSLPTSLQAVNNQNMAYKVQNMEIENAMLKNELNVINREVSELLDRLHRTEDDLTAAQTKLENFDLQTCSEKQENIALTSQIEQLKREIQELSTVEINKYKQQQKDLEVEMAEIRDKNKELQEEINQINNRTKENGLVTTKLENELRHAQSTINELQNNLDKSTGECVRLEKDWETYKLRVKTMLSAKDTQIKALQDGMNLTEDSRILMEQLESLKEERESLSHCITQVRGECEEMKQYVDQLESKHSSAERVVIALREALKEERDARNKAESHCIVLGKELKTVQMETSRVIASLKTALREKENELDNLMNTSSNSVDSSAVNVAEYDSRQSVIDKEKIHQLTQSLVHRQGKIDSLLADNNILKIQYEKLEHKYKTELASLRTQHAHSVVHVSEESRSRSRSKHAPSSVLSVLSLRIGVVLKRFPIFRLLIVIYMAFLHFWVLTVLFTSTPEDFVKRPTKT